MRGQAMRFQLTAIGLACVTLLTACGGGGGGSSDGSGSGGGSSAATGNKFQSVNFPFPGSRSLKTEPAPLLATATSELALTFASNTPAICTVTDGKLVPLKPGECSVTASQAGDSTYAPASSQQLFKVIKHKQDITFESPGFQAITGTPPLLAASSDSGLAITYSAITPAVCTVSGTTLTLVSKGQCMLAAEQAGDDNYQPALPQMVSFLVGDAPPPVLTLLSGYASATSTKEGGAISTFAGSNVDGWWCSDANWCSSKVGAGGNSYTFSYLIQTQDPKHPFAGGDIGAYAGLEFLTPGVASISETGDTTAGVKVDKHSSLKLNLAQNTEWFSSGTKNMRVVLVLGHFNKKASDNNKACNVALNATITPKSAASQNYELQLASFTSVGESCDLAGLNPAIELATYPIVKVKIEAAQTNTSVRRATAASPTYPTEITVTGAITLH